MLRAGGAAVVGGLFGAVTVSSTAQQATAAETDLDITGDSVTVRGQEPSALWLDVSVGWAYSLPSGENPDTATIELLAGRDETDVVASATEDAVFLEADGEQTFSVDLIDAGVVSPAELVPDDGGEVTLDIEIGVGFEVSDVDGLPLAVDSETDTAPITVEASDYDPAEFGDVAGAGELTVELE